MEQVESVCSEVKREWRGKVCGKNVKRESKGEYVE